MNSLSILIYAAEVAGTLKLVGGLGLIACFFSFLFIPPKGVKFFSYEHPPFSGVKRLSIWFAFFLCLFFVTFVPSQRTIYMIAASEVGEQVVNTPEAKEVMEAVRGADYGRIEGWW